MSSLTDELDHRSNNVFVLAQPALDERIVDVEFDDRVEPLDRDAVHRKHPAQIPASCYVEQVLYPGLDVLEMTYLVKNEFPNVEDAPQHTLSHHDSPRQSQILTKRSPRDLTASEIPGIA
ncbi:hypothetical protein GCM10025859_07090 [Alicyclobacillus fastidiosus]|nr:hypothetical protein GCM10025859_07090 [Alicyclobacillus fastidiosus]